MNVIREGYEVVAEIPTKGEAADKVKENFGIRLGANVSSILLLRPIRKEKII